MSYRVENNQFQELTKQGASAALVIEREDARR